MVATHGKMPRIPLTAKLKARSLYLIHGLPYAEIAAQTGLSPQRLRNMAVREGWTKSKAGAKEALLKRADARMAAEIDEISAAIATESEEIAMSGLKRSREAAESDGKDAAKDFQAWTGGARNLVNIARACRGLDRNGNAGESAPSVTNIFAVGSLTFGAVANAGAGATKPEPVNVTPTDASVSVSVSSRAMLPASASPAVQA